MVFPEMTLIRSNLGECSVAFMALENRDLSARIGAGLGDRNGCLRVGWDVHSSVIWLGRHGRSLQGRPAAIQGLD